jgi:curved DNA-binding protein CbpA
MSQETFRGDPYAELGVAADASQATIKRRWRELVRDSHPDLARDTAEQSRLTRRTARINAAWDVLRDPERRARYDARSGRHGRGRSPEDGRFRGTEPQPSRSGPPAPRPSRPVTARFDASELFHRRNSTTGAAAPCYSPQRPVSARERQGEPEPLRASRPNGPVERRRRGRGGTKPSLVDALATPLEFGKFRGHTLGEVADFEPTYIDWIARTITRDRELVVSARVIQADLDARGVERRVRAPTPGFGSPRDEGARA